MQDKTEFRIGRSHGDIVYHHVEGRDYKQDPRYAVCQSPLEAAAIAGAMNDMCKKWSKNMFEVNGLRW